MLLGRLFYQSDDVVSISKSLLGKAIYTSFDDQITAGIIVETEAYRGPDDKACHAFGNRLTKRTETMFKEGGALYVYLSYGLHKMINVVSSKEGEAHAILIRAIEPIVGIDKMLERRSHNKLKLETVNGPGKTASALGVELNHNGFLLYQKESGIWIEDSEIIVSKANIQSGPRVGLSVHLGKDAHLPWRFYLRDNKWVSKPKIVTYNNIPKE